MALKSHRLWVPEGPHVIGSGGKPSRKHGSTVRRCNKLVQTRCIHTSCKDRGKAQRPSAFMSKPCKRHKLSTPELSAQLNLTNDHQKKEEPHLKHVLMPSHGHMSCSEISSSVLSWAKLEKEVLSWLPAMHIGERGDPRDSGKLFQHSLDRRVTQ